VRRTNTPAGSADTERVRPDRRRARSPPATRIDRSSRHRSHRSRPCGAAREPKPRYCPGVRGLVVLLCAWVAGLAAAGTLPAAVIAPTVAPNCLGKPVVKPSEVVLACADAGLGVRAIHWLGWGSTRAAGLGTAFANDCSPTCVAGHFHTYRAVLVLSGSQRCAGRVGYREAAVAIVGQPPAAWTTAAGATYPLRCAS
jgi:hypothetical protein